jgi:hypothetical protein
MRGGLAMYVDRSFPTSWNDAADALEFGVSRSWRISVQRGCQCDPFFEFIEKRWLTTPRDVASGPHDQGRPGTPSVAVRDPAIVSIAPFSRPRIQNHEGI